jgi:hypothetical protein
MPFPVELLRFFDKHTAEDTAAAAAIETPTQSPETRPLVPSAEEIAAMVTPEQTRVPVS